MSFSQSSVAFATAHGYRMIWIPGAFGNGKTLLACGMYAQYFKPRGYKLVSNIQSIWTEPDLDAVKLDENGYLKAFILVDEGGQYFEEDDLVKHALRNPRKMDYILCFPSFHPPHRTAQIFQIQPVWSYRSAGIPYIHYEWSVKIGNYKNRGSFGWWWFQEMFGTYSSQNPGAGAAKIRTWLDARNSEFRQRFGYDDEDKVLDGEEGTRNNELLEYAKSRKIQNGIVDKFTSELAYIEEKADDLQTLSSRNAKRGQRRR